MHTVHRIYVGARNTPSGRILPNDELAIKKILNSYLKGWNITKTEGQWGGTAEECWIITVVGTPDNKTGFGNGLPDAIDAIANECKQFCVMWESNGTARIVPTAGVSVMGGPLAGVKIGVKKKAKNKIKR